jgi:DNA-binding response OmpR family regulator
VKVLSFGYVEEFLKERHELLVSAGLQVTSVASKSEAIKLLETKEFSVLLVGHGVPAEQRNQVAVRAKLWSKALVIFLYRWNISKAEYADAVLSVDGCAEHLLETIRRISSEVKVDAPARQKRRIFGLG